MPIGLSALLLHTLTALAFATALPRRTAEGKYIQSELEAEDVLERPLKVFTYFDRRYTRIGKTWRDCLPKAVPRPLASMSVEATEIAKNTFLSSSSDRTPTENFATLLLNEWATKLTVTDTLHADPDAFLLQDPAKGTIVSYPEADIVAAVDCVHDGQNCSWYRRQGYLDRHNGKDPLEAQGFMLSTGFMYMRSQPATTHLMKRALGVASKGESEQVAINEALLDFRCTWTTEDGFTAPRGQEATSLLQTGVLHGLCSPHLGSHDSPDLQLRVVALPYSVVPRGDGFGSVGPQSLAYHPGGTVEDKEKLLGQVRGLCKR